MSIVPSTHDVDDVDKRDDVDDDDERLHHNDDKRHDVDEPAYCCRRPGPKGQPLENFIKHVKQDGQARTG